MASCATRSWLNWGIACKFAVSFRRQVDPLGRFDEDRANLQASSMIKFELVQRIASQNPPLYQRDIEKIVSAILDEMVEALRRGDRVDCEVLELFRLNSEGHVKGGILVLMLSSRSQRKLFLSSRRERRCERGSIAKPCRQTDSRYVRPFSCALWVRNGHCAPLIKSAFPQKETFGVRAIVRRG